MKQWILAGVCILGMLSLTAFTDSPVDKTSLFNEITAVINKNTSEKELEDLKSFFKENGIEFIINNLEFNEAQEITSLSVTLKKGKSKSKYSSSSGNPISEIELGYKDGSLYINNNGMFDITAWKNQSGFQQLPQNIDSILKKHRLAFDFDFDEETDSLFFKGHFDVHKFKDQIMQSFSFERDEDGNFTLNGHPMNSFHDFSKQRYKFIDNPDIEKLIIIDGAASNFETLDRLAKDNELAEVDFLKPQTAISIYGDKAKDGAIIATTKQ